MKKNSFIVSIFGAIIGIAAGSSLTASARYFLKKTIDLLFGKMKHFPERFSPVER